jgi:hypothetical protein
MNLQEFDLEDFGHDPLLHFCLENFFTFTFSILTMKTKTFKVIFFDLNAEDSSNLCESTMELFRRQIGVLLQHKSPKVPFSVATKKSHDEPYEEFQVASINPPMKVPQLIKLLDRQKHPKLDETRYKLLKWMIGEEKLKKQNLKNIPAEYFIDILTLVFLTSQGFISIEEADLILLTVKHVELDTVPKNLQAPNIVDKRAFRISFLYTTFFGSIQLCLEIVGLKSLKSVRKTEI